MLKCTKSFQLLLLLSFYLLTLNVNAKPATALFSPMEGKEAFQAMYNMVQSAEKSAHLAIYSWSDKGITTALKELLKSKPQVKVRIVLHRPLAKKAKIQSKIKELESLGAMVKMAKMNMHEKFIIIDSKEMVNTSANMSSGAKLKYSEDFIFITSDGEQNHEELISSFEREFSILWNTADDIVTENEIHSADELSFDLTKAYRPKKQAATLVTSTMNFDLKNYKETSASYKKGRRIKMVKRKNREGELAFIVSSHLIEEIDKAQTSIDLSLNHFNLESVSKALIRAVKRGVQIRLAVDNQEFKTKIRDTGRKSIEMTPRFVRDFKKLDGNKRKEAPVRIKFYSHAPHFASWLLNHHKYILIDYNQDDLSKTKLIAGSFNISRNAEFNQFDNIVIYRGDEYSQIYKQYKNNHNSLWYLNRDQNDSPNQNVLDYYLTKKKNSLLIHALDQTKAISLTWKEAIALKKKVHKMAPNFFRNVFSNKACYFFNMTSNSFHGGFSCK